MCQYVKKVFEKILFDKKIIIYQMTMSISLYMVFSIIFKYNNTTTTIILFLKNTLKIILEFKKIIMFSNIMIKIIMFLYIFIMYLHVSSKKYLSIILCLCMWSFYISVEKNFWKNCAKNFIGIL